MAELPTRLYPESCQYAMDALLKHVSYTDPETCKVTEYEGYMFIPGFPADTVGYVKNEWEPRDGDIIISAYPKCGSHFLGNVVRNILFGRDPRLDKMTEDYPDVLGILEAGPIIKHKATDSINLPRRYLFTHLPADLMPMDKILRKDVKIIFSIRNSKDRLISWYHFTRTMVREKLMPLEGILSGDWNQFCEEYLDGKQPVMVRRGETYEDHIKTWLPYIDNKNVMLIYFEDIKMYPEKKMKEIADFIGVDLSKKEVADIAQKTNIKTLLSKKTEHVEELVKRGMLRKGEVGQWEKSELMTAEQAARIDEMVKRKLDGTGIKFTDKTKASLS